MLTLLFLFPSDGMAGFAIMAANFISNDEASQNIVNAFLQRRLQYIITALKKLEIATARHRANKEAAATDSSTNDEYSVHGYVKGACAVLLSPILLLKKRWLPLSSFLSFSTFNSTLVSIWILLRNMPPAHTHIIAFIFYSTKCDISEYSNHCSFFTTQL